MAATVNPTISSFTLDKVSKRRTAKGYEIRAEYVGPINSGVLDSFYAAHPFGEEYESSGATLFETDEQHERGSGNSAGVLRITLSYKPPDSSGAQGAIGGTQAVGYSSLESDSNPVEWPIEKKPPASSGTPDATWLTIAADLKGKGTQSWIEPQPTVTRTDVVQSDALSMTESEIIGSCGKVLTNLSTWGVIEATAEKWLMTGKRITLNGETKTIVRTAQYASGGWDVSYIYQTGAESP